MRSDARLLEEGVWRLTADIVAPPRLLELVESRLEGLDEAGRRAVQYLAVADTLGISQLVALAGAPAVEAIEERGLLQLLPEGNRQQARLAHPLYGELVRRRMGAIAGRSVRRALAGAVRDAGARRREDALQVGTWQLDSGMASDADLLLEAARQAQQRFDPALTERLAGAARDAGGGVAAGLLIVESYFEQGRAVEAETLLAKLEG